MTKNNITKTFEVDKEVLDKLLEEAKHRQSFGGYLTLSKAVNEILKELLQKRIV